MFLVYFYEVSRNSSARVFKVTYILQPLGRCLQAEVTRPEGMNTHKHLPFHPRFSFIFKETEETFSKDSYTSLRCQLRDILQWQVLLGPYELSSYCVLSISDDPYKTTCRELLAIHILQTLLSFHSPIDFPLHYLI